MSAHTVVHAYKSTENLLMCHPPKIKFTRERRLTQFSSQMNQLKYGKTITPILVNYLTHVLHNLDGRLQRKLQAGYNRGRKIANQSGVKSTTPNSRQNSDSLGIFSNRWGSSAILEESEERTVAMAHKWKATASMQTCWALATTAAWEDRSKQRSSQQ
jgi:hypothetical protein